MKRFFGLLLSLVTVAVCSSLIAPIAKGNEVSAVSQREIVENANESRFLNMLNHNFVYNEDFEDADAIVNNSVLALLNLRDSVNEDYINESYVKGFVKDMYGIDVVDMSALNTEYPQVEGYLYIVPRGYTTYEHNIVSVEANPDGSYTVVSEVVSSAHDADSETQTAVSLFVKNEESAFGYNMIYCNILADGTAI